MKILVTGRNGQVGGALQHALVGLGEIVTLDRSQLDLSNEEEVKKYFQNKFFDVVIHCAIIGGRRTTPDTAFVLQDNLKMFFNLMNNKNNFD